MAELVAQQVDSAGDVPEFFVIVCLGVVVVVAVVLGLKAIAGLIDDLFGGDDR